MTDVEHSTVLDSGQQHLGSVYAKALLGAAEKAGSAEEVLLELEAFVDDILVRLPNLETVLSSPRVPIEAKEGILDKALEGKASDTFLNFLKVIARRGRFECLVAIARAARQLFNESRGRVEAHLSTANELDETAVERIKQKLQETLGREVDLKVHHDESVIGGVVVRVGDTVYDGSVANRLERMRQEMLTRSGEKIRSQPDQFAVSD